MGRRSIQFAENEHRSFKKKKQREKGVVDRAMQRKKKGEMLSLRKFVLRQ